MKKLLFILIAGVMSFGTLNAQLVSVFHEVAYTDDGTIAGYPAGFTTYRIYASMTDPTDFLSSVYAATNDQLMIGSSTNTIWNSNFGTADGGTANPAFWAAFPEAQWDSYYTIGRASSVDPGGAINVAESNPGTALADGFTAGPAAPELDGNVTVIDGAWFALNGDANGLGTGLDNRVLLAQITTDGTLEYNLNIQMFPLGVGANQEQYVGDCNTVGGTDIDGSCMGLHFPEDALCCAPASDCGLNVLHCYDNNETSSWSYYNGSGSGVAALSFNGGSVESSSFDSFIVYDGPDNTYPVIYSNPAATTDLTGMVFYATGNDITLELTSDGSWSCNTGEIAGPWDYDVLCVTPPVFGCMDTGACNFDSLATVDDGSCDYSCIGCMDTLACNYDALATMAGPCDYAPANDLCTNAIDITADINGAAIAAETNSCSTEDGPAHSCSGFGSNFDVFYSFTYGGGDVTLETFETGSHGDTRMSVYDACGGTEIACDDDAGAGFMSMITVGCPDLTVGNSYIVQIGGFNGAIGDYELTITQTDVDGCTDSLATNYDACATNDDTSCLYSAPSCGDNVTYCYVNNDVQSWTYSVDDASANIIITFNGGSVESSSFDVFTVYDGPDNLSPVLYSNPAATTDLTGMVFMASGVDITIEFTSDGSWSCDSGEIAGPWDYDISCADLVPGCTDAGACNYDSLADYDDGSCDYSCVGCMDSLACNYDAGATIAGTCDYDNDGIDCATPIMPSAFGTCNTVAGNMTGATDSPESDFNWVNNNVDRWYSFVAMSPGASIKLTTTDFDAQLILLDAAYTEVDEDDENFSLGDEILNIGNLVEGDTYFISASSYGAIGAGDYEICVETLPDTRCDYGAGPYDLCDMFKADWVGADGYHFYFTGQTDAITYDYENWDFPQDYVQLFDVAGLPWDQTYDVAIDALYDRVDGNGAAEQIDVVNNEPCTMIVEGSPTAQVHPGKNCANHGPHWLGNYISATPWICGSVDWTWEFTRTDVTELPFEHFGSTFYNYLRLSEVAGLVEGATYDVRVKPEFANGAPTVYGATQCISIIGPAGDPVEGPVAMENNIERIEDLVVTPEASIYPNPNAGDFFNINLVGVQSETITVDIYDVVGTLVQAEEITVNEGSVNSIVKFNNEVSSGMYVVNITMDGTVMSERLVIEK